MIKKLKKSYGYTIVAVIGIMVITLILIEGLVLWIQNESRWAVKFKRSTTAFHLAEAGIDRGAWKLKSSTGTWNQAKIGTVIAGYDFDETYSDVPGGEYRIQFSSGPESSEVTVTSEGRDPSTKEVRAIKVIYGTNSVDGCIVTRGGIMLANAYAGTHWGPILSIGNISYHDAVAAQQYYPRKFSRQVVVGHPSAPRDTNGMDPPNTDNVEWWSAYPVPDLPVFDFALLRESAQATNTLNVYGCASTGAAWVAKAAGKCNGSGVHTDDFQMSDSHPLSKKNYVWYWDNNLELTGGTGSSGIMGTLIIRGNFLNNSDGNMSYVGQVPAKAWQEYKKIDTAAKNEYPADDGYRKNRATFNFGAETWTGGPAVAETKIGVKGLLYIGGDVTFDSPTNINGAVYVAGNINKVVGKGARPVAIFYDETAAENVPGLNVSFTRQSWQEIAPNQSTPWP